MVKRKTGKRKRPRKTKSRKSDTLKTHLLRIIAGLSVLILLIVAAGFLVNHLIQRKEPARSLQTIKKTPVHEKQVKKTPEFEVYPKEEVPSRKRISEPEAPLPPKIPKIAIIIDDLGYDWKMAERFLELDAVFTFSLLPFSPFQKKIAGAARAKGFETMLHLPMEPTEYPEVNPGAGALLESMTPDQLIVQLNKNLDEVPFIGGVNNHMGSRMTTSSTQMYQIFSILKKRGLFFIDSRSTPETLCKPSARLFQIPFGQRDIFLDHIPEPAFIRKQVELLVEIGYSRGEAIGIAHPHRVTYEILQNMLPDLKKKVLLVPASAVVHLFG